MSNILAFPSGDVCAWSEWEKIYRRASVDGAWSDQMLSVILARMRLHHQSVTVPGPVIFNLPAIDDEARQAAVNEAIADGVKQLEVTVSTMMDELFVRLFEVEIALYKTRH